MAAKHLGHTWYIGKRFCKSRCVIISTLSSRISSRIESMEFQNRRAASLFHSGEKWETNTRSRSELPVWTVSQKFSHLQWRRLFKELWERPTTTVDFGSSFRQILYTSHVCLLEDKIQDRDMYLFTIPYGSYALDQRSGDGWFSGWFDVFVINTRYFKCRTLKYSMRGLLQHWTESSIILTSEEESVWRNKRPKSRTVSFVEDTSLTWSTSTSGLFKPMILVKFCRPIYSFSTKWWYSGIRFEVGRN